MDDPHPFDAGEQRSCRADMTTQSNGGRSTRSRYGGSFKTMREAKLRRDWIAGELAALRVPDLALLVVMRRRRGHDAWVIGDETAVAIDWGGANILAKPMS